MSPWLELCRQAVADLRRVLADLPTRHEREPVLGRGLGGDDTTAIDGAAERAVVARLQDLHAQGIDFTLVSEELGERVFGQAGRWWVVLDPIDGSVNAKRGIPFFSLSLAVADGPRMRDVVFGFVHDFGTDEEWTAVRGEGAHLDGVRLGGGIDRSRLVAAHPGADLRLPVGPPRHLVEHPRDCGPGIAAPR